MLTTAATVEASDLAVLTSAAAVNVYAESADSAIGPPIRTAFALLGS